MRTEIIKSVWQSASILACINLFIAIGITFSIFCLSGSSVAGPFAYVPGGSGEIGAHDYAVVYKTDLTNGYKTTTIPLDAMPYGITVHRNGNLAFITTQDKNKLDGVNLRDGIGTIVVLDTITRKQVQKISTGKFPWEISINYDRKELYVGAENVLIAYDLLTYAKKKEHLVKGTPFRILFDKFQRFAFFFTKYKDAAYVLDMESGSLVELAIIDSDLDIWDVVVDRQGKTIYFSSMRGRVYVGNVESMQIINIIDLGPDGEFSNIAASMNSDEIYVSTRSGAHDVIVVLNSITGEIIRRFGIPGQTTNINTSEYFPDDLFVITDTDFVVLDKESGTIKYTERVNNNGACCIAYAQVPPTIGNFVPNAPKDQIDSDRLFNWAEDKYPMVFSSPPQRPLSETADGYYFRYYPGTDTYLGTKSGNVFYLPAGAAMNEIIDLGTMDKFLPNADADGY